MNLPVIDDIAWIVFRFVGLVQVMLWQVIGMLNPPKGLSGKIDFMGRIYAGYYIWGAADRSRVPRIVRDRGLMVGRLLLVVFVISLAQGLAQKILVK